MLARPPKERRTGEGGEKLKRDATAPQAHRRSHGHSGSSHRTIASGAQDIPEGGGQPAIRRRGGEGRGETVTLKTTVRITESHRHSSFHPE